MSPCECTISTLQCVHVGGGVSCSTKLQNIFLTFCRNLICHPQLFHSHPWLEPITLPACRKYSRRTMRWNPWELSQILFLQRPIFFPCYRSIKSTNWRQKTCWVRIPSSVFKPLEMLWLTSKKRDCICPECVQRLTKHWAARISSRQGQDRMSSLHSTCSDWQKHLQASGWTRDGADWASMRFRCGKLLPALRRDVSEEEMSRETYMWYSYVGER